MAARQPQSKSGSQKVQKKAFDVNDYIKPTLPKEEILELKVLNEFIKLAFDIFDEDKSGHIEPNELMSAFEHIGFHGQSKFIYQVLSELDQDGNGTIDFKEFLDLATAKVSDRDLKSQVQKVFSIYDNNKEGRITWDELKRVAQDLGEEMTDEEVQHMFKKADLDDDGFVTFEDFYNIITGKVYWD